jgi:hypothetical protein
MSRRRLEQTCKPGFVPEAFAAPGGDHFSRAQRLPGASSSRPGSGYGASRPAAFPWERTSSCLALLRVGFAEPDRSPGLLVSSYLTVSPLPPGFDPDGGFLSVALSLTSRPVGVTHHPALRSPDFPPAASLSARGRRSPGLLQSLCCCDLDPRSIGRPLRNGREPGNGRELDPPPGAAYLPFQ